MAGTVPNPKASIRPAAASGLVSVLALMATEKTRLQGTSPLPMPASSGVTRPPWPWRAQRHTAGARPAACRSEAGQHSQQSQTEDDHHETRGDHQQALALAEGTALHEHAAEQGAGDAEHHVGRDASGVIERGRQALAAEPLVHEQATGEPGAHPEAVGSPEQARGEGEQVARFAAHSISRTMRSNTSGVDSPMILPLSRPVRSTKKVVGRPSTP